MRFRVTALSLPSKVQCGYSQCLVKAKILMWALTDMIPVPRELSLRLPETNPGILILPVFGEEFKRKISDRWILQEHKVY